MLTSDIKKQLEEYCSVTVPYEICGFDVMFFILVKPIVIRSFPKRDELFRFEIHLDARHKEHGALGVLGTDTFDHRLNDMEDAYAKHFIDSMKSEIDDTLVFLCRKILKVTKEE